MSGFREVLRAIAEPGSRGYRCLGLSVRLGSLFFLGGEVLRSSATWFLGVLVEVLVG